PHIHFGKVADGESPEMFSFKVFAVEEVPQFGALVFWIPFAEIVAVGEKAFFGTCFFFIAASPADGAIDFMFFDSVEEGGDLKGIAGGIFSSFFCNASVVDRFLYRSYEELYAEVFYELIAESDSFREIVTGVHMQQRKRNFTGIEGFFCQVSNQDGVFSTGKQDNRVLELRPNFT